ncbi:MAG: hypothetical protein AB7S26_24235 [Sandaracinaceae bacterium]
MKLGQALTALRTEDLTNLLSRLHQGQLRCPINAAQLHVAGLSYLQDRVDFLSGLDEAGVRAVLVAVIAERRRTEREG